MTGDALAAWTRLCHHCDGIAFATTAELLARFGVLAALVERPLDIAALAAATPGVGDGLLAVACRLLCAQGHATCEADTVTLSESGHALVRNPQWYAGASGRLMRAQRLLDGLLRDGPDTPAPDASPDDHMPDLAGPERIGEHARGPAVAAALWGLAQRDLLDRLGDGARLDGVALRAARVLAEAAWATCDADGMTRLTQQGRAAAAMAAQYAYPLSYLALLANPFTTCTEPPTFGAAEQHVDRARDIAFSAEVFVRTTGRPILAQIAPFFDSGEPAREPIAIVDTGSGDGTLLAATFEMIRTRWRRGQVLESHPVLLVGIEHNDVALRATRRRLAGLGAPFLALQGDIGDPAGIAASLAAASVDPLRVLHVSKSVMHNRRYRPPVRRRQGPPTSAVFVAPDGSRIAAADAFASLVDLFEAWAPFIATHGMVVAEAHTAAPRRVARRLGANLMTLLDATHGYSRQLLMEPDSHGAARDAAGLVVSAREALHAGMVGTPLVTVETLRVPR
jgi:hypothetical protein